MTRVLLFLFFLVLSLGAILYTQSSWQLIFVFGKQKIILNFWFAMVLLLFLFSVSYWVITRANHLLRIPSWLKKYKIRRQGRLLEHARGQAIMHALSDDYKAAVQHLKISKGNATLSDLILYATWLNQLHEVQKLDEVLSQIQQMGAVPKGWMIWFRAYLLAQRGKYKLACDILLDALDSGLSLKSLVVSFAQYAQPEYHYDAISKHYFLLCRHIPEQRATNLLVDAACTKLDLLLVSSQWEAALSMLISLPKKVRNHSRMQYYKIKCYIEMNQVKEALHLLAQASFQDHRLIPLIANAAIETEQKITLVMEAIRQNPNNKELFYLLSYLQAQEGEMTSMVKSLENIMYLLD